MYHPSAFKSTGFYPKSVRQALTYAQFQNLN